MAKAKDAPCPLNPMADYLVVVPDDPQTKSHGGILIPDNAQKKAKRGKVIAAGPGSWNEHQSTHNPVDVRVGDVVCYGEYAGIELEHGTETYRVIREADVLCTVKS